MSPPFSQKMRLSELSKRHETAFDLVADAAERAAIATDLGLATLKKLRFCGTLRPVGQQDWTLEARLGATVVQPCGVSGVPVTTRIDEDVQRRYLAEPGLPDDQPGEVEMHEDDSIEPLPRALDPAEVAIEALMLALPAFPRAPGATLGEAVFTEPGKPAMREGDARPFAGLAGLRDTLTPPDGTQNDD